MHDNMSHVYMHKHTSVFKLYSSQIFFISNRVYVVKSRISIATKQLLNHQTDST